MKKKELKKIAEQIVKCEKIIQANEDKTKVHEAINKVLELTMRIESLEDMEYIDNMVQEIFSKNI